MPKINFIKQNGDKVTIDVPVGTTILQAAEANDIGLDGPCGGNLACGRCHVIIDEKWLDKLPKAEEAEENLLDTVWNVKATSRLGCQVNMTDDLDGILVYIPS